MFIIGIDPGLTGCIALLNQPRKAGRTSLCELVDMPIVARGGGGAKVRNEVDPAALNRVLQKWAVDYIAEGAIAVIEYQASRPLSGSGVIFSMGDTFGCIRAIVAVQGWPTHFVTPGSWKKYYGLAHIKGEDKTTTQIKKERSRAKAVQLYPKAPLERAKDHNRAEAILLAHFGAKVLIE